MSFHHPARSVHITTLVLGTIGSASSNRRVHTSIVTLLVVLMILAIASPDLQPDWLARP
jgi:hypothetical protein